MIDVIASEVTKVEDLKIPGGDFPIWSTQLLEIDSRNPGTTKVKLLLRKARREADGSLTLMSAAFGDPVTIDTDIRQESAEEIGSALEKVPESDRPALYQKLTEKLSQTATDFVAKIDSESDVKISMAIAVAEAAILRAVSLIGEKKKVL